LDCFVYANGIKRQYKEQNEIVKTTKEGNIILKIFQTFRK